MNARSDDFLIRHLIFIYLLIGSSLFASDPWDPALYQEVCVMQKRWAKALLDAIDLQNIRYVLDVGSGDGGITKEMSVMLAESNPNIKLSTTGLDLSQKMVDHANATHSTLKEGDERPLNKLKFIQGDAHKLGNFKNKFDLVSSFSTIHRLEDPSVAIKGIYEALRPGGKFIAAFPVFGSRIMSETIAAVDSLDKWKSYFPDKDRKTYGLSPRLIRTWLHNAGFIIVKARVYWRTPNQICS